MYRRNGLGAVWTADGTSFSYPDYCSYSFARDPFGFATLISDLSDDACQPPTPAQLNAMQRAQLSKIATVNPDAAASGAAAGDAAAAALAKTDPNARDYYAYEQDPLAETIVGPGATNWFYGIDPTNIDPNTGKPKPSTKIPGWVWVAGAGLVALFVVKGLR